MSAAVKTKQPAFRLKPVIPPEAAIHEAICHALNVCLAEPAFWACYPAGHIPMEARWASKLYRMGLRRNIPDILVWYGRETFGLEVKRPGGSLSRTRVVRRRNGSMRLLEGQREGFARLAAAGVQIAVVQNVEEALAALQRFGVPLRGHVVGPL